MKRACSLLLMGLMLFSLPGCSWSGPEETRADGVFKIAMAPDMGGVNDKSFNQSAWEGLKEFAAEEKNVTITYTESKQPSDFSLILDKFSDEDFDLILGMGFSMNDSVYDSALVNLDKNYAIVDFSYGEDTPNNVTCIMFRAEESAFLTGYIAGKFTKTNKLGFIGGMKNHIIYQFDYGFRAGALLAAKELGKNIDVEVQYADSFSDSAKGKAIANSMFARGCDVLFHAAGGVGYGAIEAAKEQGKFIVGVDRDQSYLAPNTVLTSAMKNVGQAVKLLAKKAMSGESTGGTTFTFGIKEGCVGIPEPGNVLPCDIYDDAINLSQNIVESTIKIRNKALKIPDSEESYREFAEELKQVEIS